MLPRPSLSPIQQSIAYIYPYFFPSLLSYFLKNSISKNFLAILKQREGGARQAGRVHDLNHRQQQLGRAASLTPAWKPRPGSCSQHRAVTQRMLREVHIH